MMKHCGYCLQIYTSDNETYCSGACSQKAYLLMKQDNRMYKKLREKAKKLAEEDAELDQAIRMEAAIAKWESHIADVLARRLQTIFSPTVKEVAIGPSGGHWVECLTDGRYATRVYHMDGEWKDLEHDSLEDACKALSDFGYWDLGEPEDVSLEVMSEPAL
jgi:hypothetical protein